MNNNKTEPFKIEKPIIFVVEGLDDKAFIEEFLDFLKLKDNFQIKDCGGRDNIKQIIETLTKDANFNNVKYLIVLMDNDKNAESTKVLIKNIFKGNLLPCHVNPGEFITNSDGNLNCGYYVFPSQNEEGDLETMLLKTYTDNSINRCVNNFIDCFTNNSAKFKITNKKKLQAFIITSEKDSIKDLRTAVKAKHYDFNHEAFKELKEFLSKIQLD